MTRTRVRGSAGRILRGGEGGVPASTDSREGQDDMDSSAAVEIDEIAGVDAMVALKGPFEGFPWEFATTLVSEPSTHWV